MEISTQNLIRTDLHLIEAEDGPSFHDRKPDVALSGSVTLDAQQSQELLKRTRVLRYSNQMRCHIPAYAAECHYASGASVRLSICFKCNNILVSTHELHGTIEFDAKAQSGQNLLKFLNRALGVIKETEQP
ncbi:MAG TPA: hypothetical protein VGH19_21565 [Verrucomicrobiae bacterium]